MVHANLTGGQRVTTGRQVPYCLFTDPELAHIGLSETEAQKQRIPYRLFKIPMEANLRARTLSETRGFMKAVVDAETDQILGAAVLGIEGGEIMTQLQLAMMGKLPSSLLRDAIFAHPTLAESLNNLFGHIEDKKR